MIVYDILEINHTTIISLYIYLRFFLVFLAKNVQNQGGVSWLG
jgi:hypothetical protein